MGNLTRTEEALLAYYICNFLDNKEESFRELGEVLKKVLGEEVNQMNEKLHNAGLVSNINYQITNEGIMYIDNVLHIQSDATERDKLDYVKNSLLINEMHISVEELKEYIHKNVGIE